MIRDVILREQPSLGIVTMLNDWLVDCVPHLVQLAAMPFDRVVHEEFFARIGWIVSREDWYPETCFEIHFDEVARRLVAVYDAAETGLGIGLYAICGLPPCDDYYLSSRTEYDDAFNRVLTVIEPLIPSADAIGTYNCQYDDHLYNYAYWAFPNTFMTLVQHDEGDGHAGHESSLDIRIVPRSVADRLTFPLTTNILF